jgi:hypothetical protein
MFMKNFRSLEVCGHRYSDGLVSGNFGLENKPVFWHSKRANQAPAISLTFSLRFPFS